MPLSFDAPVFRYRNASRRTAKKLSPLEHRILLLVESGKTVREISDSLGPSKDTIYGCIRNARIKLHTRTNEDAIAIARESGQLD